jgi:glutamate carboxypeptidase
MIREYFLNQREQILASAAELVNFETPSSDKVRCDALANRIAERFADLGSIERIENPNGGDHLRIRIAAPQHADQQPALILAHYDTVWPVGTLAARPFTVEGDTAYGPGLYDMKISIAMIEAVLRSLAPLGLSLARPLILLINSDEEIGSHSSRHLIEETARECAFTLVLEPPVEPHGALKTARKGVGRFDVEFTGRAAHAGVEPEKGASAITEMAHQILAINALADPSKGTTINIGTVRGGGKNNVVPASAAIEVDIRAWTLAEGARLEAGFQQLQAVTPGVSVRASGGFNRPPMERTAESGALFERAKALGAALGLDLSEGSTGGGSDGNFTAAVGVPTLDGLGAPGQGAHASHEQINVPGMLERTMLLAAMLTAL